MHEQDRAHDEKSEGLEIGHHLFTKRHYVHADASVRFRILRSQTSADRFHLSARARNRYAFLNFADAVEKKIARGLAFKSIWSGIQMSQISGKRHPLGITPITVTCLPL